jgi:hypothetical protein
VRPDGGFEDPRDTSPDRTAEHRGDDAEQDVERPRQTVEMEADVEGAHEPDPVLALAPDVEHPTAEGEGNRERRQDEGCRDEQRLLQIRELGRVRVPGDLEEPDETRAVEDRLVGGQRIGSGGEHDEPSDEEGEDGRGERDDQPAGAVVEARKGGETRASFRIGGDRHAAVSSRAPPSMAIPISSSEASGENSLTIRPS